MYKWLDNALDCGITEHEFWDMTLAELFRLMESKQRIQKREAQEKATYDYILADLIGRSIARVYNSSNKMPDIEKVYPTIFDEKELEEQRQIKRDKMDALRFQLFATSHNKKLLKKEEVKINCDD